MSAPEPKTLTPQAMTLEEALAHLSDHPTQVKSGELGWKEPWSLRYEPEQRAWAALTEYGDYVLLKEWPALITEITGVPVVARDEAAELRAAVREFFKAEAAVAALYHPNGIYTDFYEAADIANAARENLRRLAASEGQP